MQTPTSRFLLVDRFRKLGQAALFLALATSGCGQPESLDSPEISTVYQELNTTLHTSVVPTQLSLTANEESSSGTTEWLSLQYCNSLGTSFCLIQGISGNETKSCTPALGFSGTTCSTDVLEVGFVSTTATDGLRVTTLSATVSGTTYTLTQFNNTTQRTLDCSGCSGSRDNKNCNACWIDTDDHYQCRKMQVYMDTSNTTTCGAYAGE